MKRTATLLCLSWFLVPCLLLAVGNPKSQKPAQTLWTVTNPFNPRQFIENKGQFDGLGDSVNSGIRFGMDEKGTQIFFSATGLTYRHESLVPLSEEEKEEMEKEPEKENASRVKVSLLTMHWIGSNPNAEFLAEDPSSDYFTYADPKAPPRTNPQTLLAKAYRKITILNLYPGIDVEYHTMPEDKGGFKYTLILHPGANPDLIRMNYSGAADLKKDSLGNLHIQSEFGLFTDHTPKSFYKDGKSISSAFYKEGNTVFFKLYPHIDPLRTVIIDPWTTVPTFNSPNNAYRVDYDNQGNVFIYGGPAPFKLIKLNSAGTIQWTYTTNYFTQSPASFGDFTVDRVSGRIYIGEGYDAFGAKAVKVSPAGVQLASFFGNSNLNEMWRMSYNACVKQMVIGGGGPTITYQGSMLDTNLASVSPVNMFNATQGENDITLLAIDNFGSAYMATNKALNFSTNSNFNNSMFKVPIPALSPTTWLVNDGHAFNEDTQTSYVQANTTGYNGMAVSPNFLYTYDGGTLKKWNMASGASVATANVGSNPNFKWAGISVDPCDNIYMGYQTSIKQYDMNMSPVSTMPAADTVYDVKLGANNILYCCGRNFVSALHYSGTPCVNATATTVPANCASTGSASVTMHGGTAPYTYSWNTVPPQTGQTATGLVAGTYIVTVKDAACVQNVAVDTVVITASGGPTLTVTSTNSTCGSSNASASVSATGGTGPYTYSWSTSPSQTSASVSNISAGTYTCTVTDANGCVVNHVFQIATTPNPTGTLTIRPSTCGRNNGAAQLSLTGGTSPYTYSWQTTPVVTIDSVNGLAPGVYTVTVYDANGCTFTDTAHIAPSSKPSISFTSNGSLCGRATGSATVQTSGGVSPYTYSWSTIPPLTTQTISNQNSGTYTCTVYDNKGCDTTGTIFIPNIGGPAVAVSAASTTCGMANGIATANPSSGNPPYTYSWSTTPPQTTQTALGLAAGTYTVVITDANGCSTQASTTVAPSTSPTATVSSTPSACANASGTATVNPSGGTTPYTYYWNLSPPQTTATASGLAPGVYTVTVTDAHSCSVQMTDTVHPITPTPSGTVTVVDPFCSWGLGSATVTGTGGSAPYTFTWQTNPPQTGATAINLPQGTYVVQITDANGCVGQTTATITVPNPLLITIPTTPPTICPGASASITATGSGGTPGYTYSWTPGGYTTASISVHPPVTMLYHVTVIDANGCTAHDSIKVTLAPKPLARFTADTFACKQLCSHFLNASLGAIAYLWNFGDGDTSHAVNPTHCYNPGSYSVELIATTSAGCTDSIRLSNYIHVYPLPVASFFPSPLSTSILQPQICYANTSTGASIYTWDFGDSLHTRSNFQNPCFAYSDAGEYCTELVVVSPHGCRDSAVECITILPDATIYVPNAFTPDGNGLNDGFRAEGTNIDPDNFKMWIFDRWGNMIWETDRWGKSWDGRANGGKDIAQQDVYVWKIVCKDILGKKYSLLGHVSLVK